MEQTPLVQLKHVGIKFGQTVVHRDINFSINKSEVVTILGPSGTGKTVILKLIMGLLRPTSGEVLVEGRNICSLSEDELVEQRRKVGFLFQGAALFDSINVFENVAYALREIGTYSEESIREIVEEKLSLVGLPDVQHKAPSELSGGQKKRVGLARALAASPKLILFDEPTTGLDPTTIRLIDNLIMKLRDEHGITSIVVTHDIESARRFSNRWILINKGVIRADGPVDVVSHENEDVKNFVTGNWLEEISGSKEIAQNFS